MIVLKSRSEIERIRASNLIVVELLELLQKQIKEGVSTLELDEFSERYIRKKGAYPAFKGYNGYQHSICTSINNEVVHGIPSRERVLLGGDIISIDCGVCYQGFYGDAAVTLAVGEISAEAQRLLEVTEGALYRAIEKARVGSRLSDVSYAIQSFAEQNGYSVVREFVGHGIGRELHEEPQIPNFGNPGEGVRLKAGMVLAIEPMINQRGWEVKVLEDGWTAVTVDGGLSAHFEHSVAITENGPYILSKF